MSERVKLSDISTAVRSMQADFALIDAEMAVETERRKAARTEKLEKLIMAALEDYTIVDVATAYTVSGKTPNRGKIHAIKRKYTQLDETPEHITELPFEWVPREVVTVNGVQERWDVHGNLDSFGPDKISGEFVWTADSTGLSRVITDDEPYPYTTYYNAALASWLNHNPYPGE